MGLWGTEFFLKKIVGQSISRPMEFLPALYNHNIHRKTLNNTTYSKFEHKLNYTPWHLNCTCVVELCILNLL